MLSKHLRPLKAFIFAASMARGVGLAAPRPFGRAKCSSLEERPLTEPARVLTRHRLHKTKRAPHGARFVLWRMGWDSNPRYAFDVYTLSRRAPSTARPPIQRAESPRGRLQGCANYTRGFRIASPPVRRSEIPRRSAIG